MYVTINRNGTRRATISEVAAVRTSGRAPGRAGEIDTVRMVVKVALEHGIRSTHAQVELSFDRDAINLDPTLAANVDALIEALTAMREGATSRKLPSDTCVSCGRRRDDHRVRHVFTEGSSTP